MGAKGGTVKVDNLHTATIQSGEGFVMYVETAKEHQTRADQKDARLGFDLYLLEREGGR